MCIKVYCEPPGSLHQRGEDVAPGFPGVSQHVGGRLLMPDHLGRKIVFVLPQKSEERTGRPVYGVIDVRDGIPHQFTKLAAGQDPGYGIEQTDVKWCRAGSAGVPESQTGQLSGIRFRVPSQPSNNP